MSTVRFGCDYSLSEMKYSGFNLARQRDKLVLILEDMNELHEDACRADSICREIVPLHNKCKDIVLDVLFDVYSIRLLHPLFPDNPFVTFVFTQTLALVVYHIELSFRLDLFAPFEYTYMYWLVFSNFFYSPPQLFQKFVEFRFYGEVVGRWYMTSIEKTREIMRDTLNKGGIFSNLYSARSRPDRIYLLFGFRKRIA